MVYDEMYGELSFAERAAIRKYNVSPSDYWDLEEVIGKGKHGEITAAIKACSGSGMFRTSELREKYRRKLNF